MMVRLHPTTTKQQWHVLARLPVGVHHYEFDTEEDALETIRREQEHYGNGSYHKKPIHMMHVRTTVDTLVLEVGEDEGR